MDDDDEALGARAELEASRAAADRRHAELMARLDRIAEALEAMLGRP